jgi:hypothetical protein
MWGSGPSREPRPDVSVHASHVCRNLVFEFIYSFLNLVMPDINMVYLFILWGLCGSVSVRDLLYLELCGQVSVHDFNYWNFILKGCIQLQGGLPWINNLV